MQPSVKLLKTLRGLADEQRYLFTLSDLGSLVPNLSRAAFKSLLSRLVGREELFRVCRGLYRPAWIDISHGWILHHAAARLRADTFTYLSLESVLSETGHLSQIPMQSVTLMTRGRGGDIDCGPHGHIAFTHTAQTPEQVMSHLWYDPDRRLWIADEAQALRDLRQTGRHLDLLEETTHDAF